MSLRSSVFTNAYSGVDWHFLASASKANHLLRAVVSGQPGTYTWDARGHLVGGVFTYTCGAAGQRMRAQCLTATLVYNCTADGRRVGQSTNGILTTYAWDWAVPVPELLAHAAGLQSILYRISHETRGWAGGGGWRYVLPDALGSVRQIADAAGVVVSAREGDPYGREVGGWQKGLGYGEEWQERAVGLLYLWA
ncbi:MAG: hypothetical protein RML46_09085 [Anaerolineae bacterium]|nr:hypothetical protein [Anaerolineae bacterium]